MKPIKPGDPEVQILSDIEELSTQVLDWDCITVGEGDGVVAMIIGTEAWVEQIRAKLFDKVDTITKLH